jgi:hypothetical protein
VEDAPAGPAGDPFDGDTPEEIELFGQALSVAVATAAAAQVGEEEAERHIRERQQRIWQTLAIQRRRARKVVALVQGAERLAESAVRQDRPGPQAR